MPNSNCSFQIDAEQNKAAKMASTVRYKQVLSNESDGIKLVRVNADHVQGKLDGIKLVKANVLTHATCPQLWGSARSQQVYLNHAAARKLL